MTTTGPMFRLLRVSVAAVALLTVREDVSTAADMHCWACEQCMPELPCLQCSAYTINAIGGCCGAEQGAAYCVGGQGFNVLCNNENQCHCDEQGNGCDPLNTE